jgi:hypothetical protein
MTTPTTEAGRAYVEWDDAAVEGGAMERITGKRYWTTTDAVLAIEAEARNDYPLLLDVLAAAEGLIDVEDEADIYLGHKSRMNAAFLALRSAIEAWKAAQP